MPRFSDRTIRLEQYHGKLFTPPKTAALPSLTENLQLRLCRGHRGLLNNVKNRFSSYKFESRNSHAHSNMFTTRRPSISVRRTQAGSVIHVQDVFRYRPQSEYGGRYQPSASFYFTITWFRNIPFSPSFSFIHLK